MALIFGVRCLVFFFYSLFSNAIDSHDLDVAFSLSTPRFVMITITIF